MALSRRQGELDADSALKSYFADPEWTLKTGIGGTINAASAVLAMLNPLTLPLALALMSLSCGYMLRVIRYKSLNREARLPAWDEWLELFLSGLTWLAIQFGLTFIQVSVVTLSFIVASAIGAIKIAHPAFFLWLLLTALAVVAVSVALSFLNPFLMVNFAIEERPQAGFAFRKVVRRASGNPGQFVAAWIVSIGVMWVSVVLPVLTVIGVFLIPSTVFIGHAIAATMCAQVWGQERQPDR